MKINNVRLGFATNSSSSHSVVLLPDDELPSDWINVDNHEYGWENFILSSKESKADYLAAFVGRTLVNDFGEQVAKIIIKELFGVTDWNKDWYVDHNSDFFTAHRNAVSKKIDIEFLQDLWEFTGRRNVVILGGNDNSGWEYADDLLEKYEALPGLRRVWNTCLCTKNGDWWTLFNPSSGAKLTFSFEDTPGPKLRPRAPELVDMKITDFCDAGCVFCYQSSHHNGKHADLTVVEDYLERLSKLGTFEITFGGGEPTSHPDFIAILKKTTELGMVANFTTNKLNWSEDFIADVKKYAKGVGKSVNSMHQLHMLIDFYKKSSIRLTPHIVDGTLDAKELTKILAYTREQYIPVVLLGFKSVGRGKFYSVKDSGISAELLRSAGRLSVDTLFAEKYAAVLEEALVSPKLVAEGEGFSSMYIDAVAETAAKSSYHPETVACRYYEVEKVWNALI